MTNLLLAVLLGVCLSVSGHPESGTDLTIPMVPCKKTRPVDSYYMSTSEKLVLEGTVTVDGEKFLIYLPEDEEGYSLVPRPERKAILTAFTSTCLAVDQNHDGRISMWESCFAENPLRIGDSMFVVKSIDDDGTLTLTPQDLPLSWPVIGRKAPDFSFTTIDGRTVTRDDFQGRALVIDCWAPS